jgi:hypothetical protein
MEVSGRYPRATEVEALEGADLDRALVALERARREVESADVAVLDAAGRSGTSGGSSSTPPDGSSTSGNDAGSRAAPARRC